MSKRRAKQADFDIMVDGFIKQEASISEACIDAIETLTRSNYDLSDLYLYHNEEEYQEKLRVENRCKTIESVLSNSSYLMNLSFAIKGLIQTIEGEDSTKRINALKLIETRKLFSTLLSVLPALSESIEDDDEEENEEEAEAKESEESEELQQIRQYYSEVFSFLNLLISTNHFIFADSVGFFELQSSQIHDVFEVLQTVLYKERLVEKILNFILLSLRVSETNRVKYRENINQNNSILERLAKIHNDDPTINSTLNIIYSTLLK